MLGCTIKHIQLYRAGLKMGKIFSVMQVRNWVGKRALFGLKVRKGFKKRGARSHHVPPGVTPREN